MTVGASSSHTRTRRRFKAVVLDLDDTLYRVHEIPTRVRAMIEDYINTKLNVPKEQVEALTLDMYVKHGTTLAGLVASGYRIDFDDWHKHVHHGAIDYQHLLAPDLSLRELLFDIDLPKYILTNADKVHMHKCLERLGISDCFQGLFYFENVMEMAQASGLVGPGHPGVVCKPNHKVYELVAQRIGVSMSDVLFCDDSTRNVAAAHELGAFTVLVGRDTPCAGADIAVPSMHELPHALPELFGMPGAVKDDHHHIPAAAVPEQHQQHAVAIPTPAS